MQGGTPAPTPPASPAPKLKKQQFQTDQTRPFLLPFSPANALPLPRDSAAGASTSTAFVSVRKVRSVPKSIDEAGELYERNLRISTELWQTWKVREECRFDEMGVSLAESLPPPAPSSPPVERMSALSMQDEEEEMDPLSMLRKLASGMQEEEDVEQDDRVRDRIKSQRGDVLRLERVEVLYVSSSHTSMGAMLTGKQRAILPQMQSAVIVLLKLLLATVTANNNIPANGQGVDSGTGTSALHTRRRMQLIGNRRHPRAGPRGHRHHASPRDHEQGRLCHPHPHAQVVQDESYVAPPPSRSANVRFRRDEVPLPLAAAGRLELSPAHPQDVWTARSVDFRADQERGRGLQVCSSVT